MQIIFQSAIRVAFHVFFFITVFGIGLIVKLSMDNVKDVLICFI